MRVNCGISDIQRSIFVTDIFVTDLSSPIKIPAFWIIIERVY